MSKGKRDETEGTDDRQDAPTADERKLEAEQRRAERERDERRTDSGPPEERPTESADGERDEPTTESADEGRIVEEAPSQEAPTAGDPGDSTSSDGDGPSRGGRGRGDSGGRSGRPTRSSERDAERSPETPPEETTDDSAEAGATSDGGAEATAASVAPSQWKVLGDLSDPSGTGVLGRNTATSGNGYGVTGTTQQETINSAGVFAEAPNGSAKALEARSRGGGPGVYATTDAVNNYAVWGVNYADTGFYTAGVRGESFSQQTGSAAVTGNTRGTEVAEVYGVKGETRKEGTDSKNPAGVFGEATSSTGRTWGVRGRSRSLEADAAGVRAEAIGGYGLWATSQDQYGVNAYSSNDYGGFFRTGAADKPGLYGANLKTDNQRGRGVYGYTTTTGSDSAGVYGRANATSGRTNGVHGVSKSSSPAASGVYGDAQSNSGQIYGVRGRTLSNDPNAAGVHGEGTTAAPAIHAEGHVSVDRVGLSAYRSTNQTIAGDGANDTVVFDALAGNRDDFNGYDTTTGVYTVQVPGDYHVDCCLDYSSSFSEGDVITYNIWVNGTASRGLSLDVRSATANYLAAESFSKLLVDLVAGDTVQITTSQTSATDKQLFGDTGGQTFLTIHKVG